ncbi:reverse transcriptase domain-containing protein [Tanacetum coccineum]
MLFPFSLEGAAQIWLEKEPPRSIQTWEDLVSKFINKFFPPSKTTNLRNEITNFQQRFEESFYEAWDRFKDLLCACPHHDFTELHHLDTFYNALNATDQDSLNAAAGDNIQRYVSAAAVNYNQGNSGYRPPSVANQIRPPGFAQPNVQNNQNRFSQPQGYNQGNNFNQDTSYQAPIQQNQVVPLSELEKIKKINEVNIKAMQTQINNVKNELRNEIQTSIQASISNQTNELKNMMASFFQMNTPSTSGSGQLPSNTIANPRGELKAITTRSGLVLDGPSVPMPPPFINPEEDERAEETLTDPELAEYTIKVPPPLVQKAKPPSLRNYMVHQRDPRHPHIPYPSRMNQEKQQEKNKVQIHKFWQMFKQLHINISLADALILIPKYQKMLKSLLSNKEKLLELANTPLNENCSAVILKKLPEKLGDPGKFLIPCGFSELKCKALADLGASINLMPLSVWIKLGLPELISTRMTLDLANRAICTPAGIARDVFVPVGKFIFLADFVIVDYENDPRVPLILGGPFLRTARALIDVHGEEMILRDDLFATNHLSGNLTPISDPIVSSSPTLTSLEESDLIWEEFEAYLASDSFPPGSDDTDFDPEGDLRLIKELLNNDPSSPLPLSHNPLSGSTTSSSPNHLLEEFADELALITFSPGNDDLPFDIESDLREIEYLLNHDPTKEIDSILEDLVDKDSRSTRSSRVDYFGSRWTFYNAILANIAKGFRDAIRYEYNLSSSNGWTKSPVLWAEIRESSLIRPELVQETTEKVVLIKEKLKAERDRQQSYADDRRKPLEFEVGDQVLLKVSPWKGVMRFGKKGKLAPRYVGPFEILERISPVAYRLRLPKELSEVHNTFYVSNLKKCLADANLHVPLDEIKIDKTLHFIEEPLEIMDCEVKTLKHSKILIVKVHWNSKRDPEFTWEREDHMKVSYTCSDSLLLTPLCCDDIHDVTPSVSALAGCDKEYLVEFWYTATSNLKTIKVFFSIPFASTKGDIGLNSFRNALGAKYITHSRDYVEPPT